MGAAMKIAEQPISASTSPQASGMSGKTGAGHSALVALGRALKKTGYSFVCPTPATHALVNGRPGNEWADTLQGIFGWSRPFRESTLAPEIFAQMQSAAVVEAHGEGWRSLVRASTLNDHLFFHSAYPTAQTDAVFFGPDTYRFVAAIDQYFDAGAPTPARIVDICCGAGPGAIALASRLPDAQVLALDINEAALNLARVNATLAGTANVVAARSDLLNDVQGDFDLIVANPPYLVDPAQRAYRHGGGPLGAGLSLAILEAALQRLSPGGTLLLYTGAAIVDSQDPFYLAARQVLKNAGAEWRYREIDPDVFGEELRCEAYCGTDRIAAVWLAVTKKA